ncbi:hypothetical protein HYU11_05300 [Candidatus Woesearchaeota archaeon]|nr:hypothetical protein [Candidatus Woesearchaeota archaeon]
MKLLIGVGHGNGDELETKSELNWVCNQIKDSFLSGRLGWLFSKIYSSSPGNVGLELPKGYEQRKNFFEIMFFGDLEKILLGWKIGSVYLDDQSLLDRVGGLEYARKVREGTLEEELLRTVFENTASSAYLDIERLPPENKDIPARSKLQTPKLGYAVKLLDENIPLEEMMRMIEEVHVMRSEHQLKRIVETGCQLVVLGDYHACQIKDRLPDYKYIRSPYVNLAK